MWRYLVVDVEVSLSWILGDDPSFLQQEVGDFPSIRSSTPTELDLKVFSLKEHQSVSRRLDV